VSLITLSTFRFTIQTLSGNGTAIGDPKTVRGRRVVRVDDLRVRRPFDWGGQVAINRRD
jgi:hypothetical protein